MIGIHYLKYVNDKAYVVKREIPIHNFSIEDSNRLNMELVKAFRDWQGCDHVLRSPTHFMFCETIPDAEIIEEVEI
tara:strand:+ start:448 stop:675 length:228 start_codon:yes stop_codon:yes gene_type:complete